MSKLSIKKLPGSLIEIEDAVSKETFDKCVAQAAKEFVSNAEIPGFRKGNAPEKLVLEKIGEARILERASELALRDVWPNLARRIMEEENIEIISPPSIQILKVARHNDLIYRARMAVLPEINLPDYRKVARDTLTNTPEDKIVVEEKEKESLRIKILDNILEQSRVELPDILVNSEQEKMFRELQIAIKNMGLEWLQYLQNIKKTEAEIKEELTSEAKKRASHWLIVKEVAKREHIAPSEEEITAQAEKLTKPYTEEQKKHLDNNRLKEYAYGIVIAEKVFQLLESNK